MLNLTYKRFMTLGGHTLFELCVETTRDSFTDQSLSTGVAVKL